MPDDPLRTVTYTAESNLRHPVRLLGEMVRDLLASRELAWRLFVRDFAAQYRQTAMGYFWAIFPPVVTSLVFILLNSSNVMRIGGTGVPYPVFVVIGSVFFELFMDALNAPLKVVNTSRAMLIKINFPREALLLSGMAQVLLTFLIRIALLAVTLAVFGFVPRRTVLLAPVPALSIFIFGTMAGVLALPLGMLFRDISYGLMVVRTGIMFLTPVVYPVPTEGLLAGIVRYNPLTPLIVSVRDYMVSGFGVYTPCMLIILSVSSMLLFLSWVLFRLAMPALVERIGTQ